MDTIVKVITTREDYDIRDSAENALSVEEVIEVLKFLPPKAKIAIQSHFLHFGGLIKMDKKQRNRSLLYFIPLFSYMFFVILSTICFCNL